MSAATGFRSVASNALHYWEPRRLVYNGVLAFLVFAGFVVDWPRSIAWLGWYPLRDLLSLAVAANILYCLAYVADISAQLSPFRDAWLRKRWLLLSFGTVLASGITLVQLAVMFLGPLSN